MFQLCQWWQGTPDKLSGHLNEGRTTAEYSLWPLAMMGGREQIKISLKRPINKSPQMKPVTVCRCQQSARVLSKEESRKHLMS